MALCSGDTRGWTQDLDPEPLGRGADLRHVRWTIGRQHPLGRRLACRPEECLVVGCGQVEETSRLGDHRKGVRRTGRDVNRRARTSDDGGTLAQEDAQLSLEDDEGLVILRLAVKGGDHTAPGVLLA